MKALLLIISVSVLSTPVDAELAKGRYHVTKVVDGDTFDATDGQITFRVRIAGMDAPEYQQRFGKWATQELRKLVERKEVTLQPVGMGIDKYNRVLGQVFLKGEDLSLLMIRQGFAFYYRPRCHDYPQDKQLYPYDPHPYIKAEAEARAAGLVIWSDNSQTLPCQFRKEHPHH